MATDRHELTNALSDLTHRVARGRLPEWIMQQLADAIGPVNEIIAKMDERAPYLCPHCERRFESFVDLARHGKARHGVALDGRTPAYPATAEFHRNVARSLRVVK